MTIDIETRFRFRADNPTDVLLQFEAARVPEQTLDNLSTTMSDSPHIARVAAQDTIGERLWVRVEGEFDVHHTASATINRMLTELEPLDRLDLHDLPGEAVPYLFDSRYCAGDRFQSFVSSEFGNASGGAKVIAMRDWIADHFAYTPGSSTPTTTALDSFVERQGICRDYAHVMITFARAAGIPARFVSCYAPDVTPQDFHAVAEVFLADPSTPGGGAWYLVDATEMADPAEVVKIGVGRDAADVSFLTSFGPTEFLDKTVSVTRSG
ncbi:transglutaminase family protein [Qipengyuania sp.]|uniref:transglutaminase-like domain-containing protein n=1 Tax=Qipengyuania sp. TaxID=2004515 RepID=UPI0035C85E37